MRARTAMSDETHWEQTYKTKSASEVSWYRTRLDTSLDLIKRAALPRESEIIDVGGGASTLVDALCGLGYDHVTVIDISSTALEQARLRLGAMAQSVHWIAGDITR